MLRIISNNCLRAERQSSHLFTWHIKAYWRAVPDSNVFIPTSVTSPQATERAVDYLIVWYTDGRLQFHCRFMIQSWESYLSAEKMEKAQGEAIIYCCTVCFAHWFLIPFCDVHKSRGNATSLCTLNLGLQINWLKFGRRIALIYGVITEFCCSTDTPGCLCLASCVWLITMKLSGPRRKQTGLMLPVV